MRGTGDSEGDFSLKGWLRDTLAAIAFLKSQDCVGDVAIAGFGTGGSLAICAAAEDKEVLGVASFGAPADFHDWANDPKMCLSRARESGPIKDESFPSDYQAWAQELSSIRAIDSIVKLPPRPGLIVHGAEDDVVSPTDARALVEAAGKPVELRMLGGGGHDLLYDPRAIAILMGWLERQTG